MEISALTGKGIEELVTLLASMAAELSGDGEPALLVRERQVQAVNSAVSHLENALKPELPIELLAENLRWAARNVGKLIGEVAPRICSTASSRNFASGNDRSDQICFT